jgi:hypothetical protein
MKSVSEAKFLQGVLEAFHTIKTLSDKDDQINPAILSDENYRNFLENMFSEVRFSNPRNFRILNYSLSQIKFDFSNFIKFICVYLQFSDGLLTNLKMINKQIHIFIFLDDENYLKEAEEYGHNFELSDEAKNYLLNDYKNNYNIPNNPNYNYEEDNISSEGDDDKDNGKNKELNEYDKFNKSIIGDIYVPFKSILIKFYKFYDVNTDMPVEYKIQNYNKNTENKEDNKYNTTISKNIHINILKKNDKIKILKNIISRSISSLFLSEASNTSNILNSEKTRNLIEEVVISNDNYNQNVQREKMYLN